MQPGKPLKSKVMSLEKIHVTGNDPVECLDLFIDTAKKFFEDKPGRWRLTGWQLIQAIQQAGGPGTIALPGTPPRMYCVCIGIFELVDPVDVKQTLRDAAEFGKDLAREF